MEQIIEKYSQDRKPSIYDEIKTLYIKDFNKDTTFTAMKEKYPKLTKKDFKAILSSLNSNSLTAKKPKVKNMATTGWHIPGDYFQMDLVDFRKTEFPAENDGVNYLLNVIDVGSRKAWSVPLKTKTGPEVAKALERIISNWHSRRRYTIVSDAGSEFENPQINQVYKRYNITRITSVSVHKAMIAERFNRSLKELLQKYMLEAGTKRLIDYLDKALHAYNSRVHSYHNLPPNFAWAIENLGYLIAILDKEDKERGDIVELIEDVKYNVGDIVRVGRIRKTFEKAFAETGWSETIFRVRSVETTKVTRNGLIPIYQLETYIGRVLIPGNYYNNDLQAVLEPEFRFDMNRIRRVNGRQEYELDMRTLDSNGKPTIERGWFYLNERKNHVLIEA